MGAQEVVRERAAAVPDHLARPDTAAALTALVQPHTARSHTAQRRPSRHTAQGFALAWFALIAPPCLRIGK